MANAQFQFKNVKEALTLSLLVIYFLNILYNLNVIFITNLIFRYCHSCSAFFFHVEHCWCKKQT